jgi:hypothetical protein
MSILVLLDRDNFEQFFNPRFHRVNSDFVSHSGFAHYSKFKHSYVDLLIYFQFPSMPDARIYLSQIETNSLFFLLEKDSRILEEPEVTATNPYGY